VELNRQELSRRLVTKLANPAVIHFYVWLLQGAARNSTRLNAALLDMLQRVCDPQGFNCEAMLYQLSVLRVFHAVSREGAWRWLRSELFILQTRNGFVPAFCT
jgi:hypothetical protein